MPGFPPSAEEITGVMLGSGGVIASNFVSNYPLYSRLPRLAVMTTLGYFIGVYVTKWKEWKIHQREVYMWDYINQHPEDFPELKEEPKKLKDVLESFKPVRY